jgi:hypothetical protein
MTQLSINIPKVFQKRIKIRHDDFITSPFNHIGIIVTEPKELEFQTGSVYYIINLAYILLNIFGCVETLVELLIPF